MRIVEQGDSAVTIYLAERRTPAAARRIAALTRRLEALSVRGLVEVVPALTSVTCVVDGDVDRTDLLARIDAICNAAEPHEEEPPGRIVEVPIDYAPGFATDLEEIALDARLSIDDVVAIHLGAVYRVAMIGFLPGFAYLEGLPRQLVRSRRSTPRTRIVVGSVAVAGEYCGIYPCDSPGGWSVLGWSPLALFEATASPPAKLAVGDRVVFRRIPLGETDP